MFFGTVSILGFLIFATKSGALHRPIRLSRSKSKTIAEPQWPKVSIVIPARNEKKNLPLLLESLSKLKYPDFEVVVVDDHSTDGTGELAQEAGCTVVTPPALPAGWVGKTWACWNGFQAATADYILFTDADTIHHPDSLKTSVARILELRVGLLSAIPYHRCVEFWEKIQASFQSLLFISTAAFQKDKPPGQSVRASSRIFAIGQYLLFSRPAYLAVGGHNAVKNEVSEDIAFATRIQEKQLGYSLIRFQRILDVRMYPEGLGDFIRGWRRNFNTGIRKAGLLPSLEVGLVIGWLLGTPLRLIESASSSLFGHNALLSGPLMGPIEIAGRHFMIPFNETALLAGSLFVIFRLQAFANRARGDYPVWAFLFYPVFVIIFCVVSLLAVKDLIMGTPVVWRGRKYEKID
jgi:glycosyltransferase involved in cell wall biosynthesis